MDLITEGVGAFIGMFTTAKLLDIVYRRQIQKKEHKSETRYWAALDLTHLRRWLWQDPG